jgi:predicted aspartyl protease
VPVRVNDIRYDLAVDTGAVSMMVSSRVARDLNVDVARALRWERLAGIGLSAPVPVVSLARVSVAGIALTEIPSFVYDLPAALRVDGLIGLNVLARFRVTFEFDTRTLVLRTLTS